MVSTSTAREVSAPGSSSEVRVLARGLAILKVFEPVNAWRSNAELALATGLPKPTVSRLTANLTDAGYLNYSSDRAAYRLATSVLALGFVAASNPDLVRWARPLMQAFADRYAVSVVLASPDGSTMVCHEVAHSRSMLFALRVRVGSRLQMGPSALGRALIGSMGDAERDRFLTKLSHLDQAGYRALKDHVEPAAKQMRLHQYCIAIGSLERGTNGAAVVIDTPDRAHSYALGCAAPANTVSVDRLQSDIAPGLLALKAELEAELNLYAVRGVD